MIFESVQLFGLGAGTLSLEDAGVKWSSRDGKEVFEQPMEELESAQWTMYRKRALLRLLWKDGSATRLEGFKADDKKELLDTLGPLNVDVEEVTPEVSGANVGDIAFEGKRLLFERDGNLVWEKDLGTLTQCVIPGNRTGANEVEMQFLESDAVAPTDDTLVEIRFSMPEAQEDSDETPAQACQQLAVERAGLRGTGGESICSFEDCAFLVPRGHYAIHIFDSFMRMQGPKYDYRIRYEDINRLCMLERPDGYRMVFVISLFRGVRQGQQRYQHLVMESNTEETVIDVNLTEEECQERFNGEFMPVSRAPLCNLIARAFRFVAKKKVFVSGQFLSSRGHKCIQCAKGANTGFLYVLDRSFVFIHKPTIIMRFQDVQHVELLKGDAHLGLRNFTLEVTLKPSASNDGHTSTIQFSQIGQEEYKPLLSFLQSETKKKDGSKGEPRVRIKNLRQADVRPSYNEMDDGDDPRARRRASAMEEEDDESDDEDFNPDEKDSDESSSGDDDSDDSGGDDDDDDDDDDEDDEDEDDEVAPKKAKKAAAAQPAKRKKKDPNAPKRATSSYFFFASDVREEVKAANPGASITDISKLIGERWKAMSEDDKKPYTDKAEADKARYAREMADYVPPEDASDDEDTPRKAKRAKKDPNAPKRATSSYFFFAGEIRSELRETHPDASMPEISKMIGERWKAMSEDDKKPYNDKAEADKARYAREMAAYRGGEDDVVEVED